MELSHAGSRVPGPACGSMTKQDRSCGGEGQDGKHTNISRPGFFVEIHTFFNHLLGHIVWRSCLLLSPQGSLPVMPINQPSNQIKFTNVSIVRLKKGMTMLAKF